MKKLAILVLFVSLSSFVYADTIYMKSGRVIENINVTKTDNLVSFYLYGNQVELSKSLIEKIEYSETEDDSNLDSQVSSASNISSISDEESENTNQEMDAAWTELTKDTTKAAVDKNQKERFITSGNNSMGKINSKFSYKNLSIREDIGGGACVFSYTLINKTNELVDEFYVTIYSRDILGNLLWKSIEYVSVIDARDEAAVYETLYNVEECDAHKLEWSFRAVDDEKLDVEKIEEMIDHPHT